MKINIYQNSNVMTAICEAIGDNHILIKDIMAARDPNAKENNFALDEVVFTVNGIELDFNNFINRYVTAWNKQVETYALTILKEKYGNLLNSINEIQEELDYQKDNICNKYND